MGGYVSGYAVVKHCNLFAADEERDFVTIPNITPISAVANIVVVLITRSSIARSVRKAVKERETSAVMGPDMGPDMAQCGHWLITGRLFLNGSV